MRRRGLDVVGDQEVLLLLDHVSVVLEVVAVVVLDPPLVVTLDHHGDHDDKDDEDDAAPDTADDEAPLEVITRQAVHVHRAELRPVASGALQDLALTDPLELPEPEEAAVTLEGYSCRRGVSGQ